MDSGVTGQFRDDSFAWGLARGRSVTVTDHAGGHAHGDGEVRDGVGDDRSRPDHTMFADVRQHHRPVTDPAIAADGDARPGALLVADRNVQAVDAVLAAA